ncbi:heme-binding domain-containing protein [Salinimicrobium soli]|uniref:heme-binding domain-containing protein n=1 Tax=Salinimicrobium soli TaxID=1254399 RepID=UPI003AAA3D8A
MKIVKGILIFLLLALIVIQFIPVEKNKSENVNPDMAFTNIYDVPEKVELTLNTSCFDCHSNNTEYRWFDEIQPVRWYIEDHIQEGKEELNFDEFGTYSQKKRAHKIEEVVEMVEDGEMPLSSYTWVHPDTRLNDREKEELITWFKSLSKKEEAINEDEHNHN